MPISRLVMIGVDIRTLLLNVRVASCCANWKMDHCKPRQRCLRPSAVAGGDAVGLTVAALPTHVGAKLQRAVGWICLHERKRHRP
jgi:hypothetical protein